MATDTGLILQNRKQAKREFTVPNEIYTYLQSYALENSIRPNQAIPNNCSPSAKALQITAEYLNLENIGTHSFRKFFAVSVYNNNNYNVELVRTLLNHSNVTVTQRYLSIENRLVELALQNHIVLPK